MSACGQCGAEAGPDGRVRHGGECPTRARLSDAGRKGGERSSRAKTRAARKNGLGKIRNARVHELMREHGCSRTWAYQLLKTERQS